MAASTPSRCFLRESESIHSVTSCHASSLETSGMGVKVNWTGENEVTLQADSVSGTEVDEQLASNIRASFLVAGPLLARFGQVNMPPPGGDTIGRRRLDAHLDAFRDMGAK